MLNSLKKVVPAVLLGSVLISGVANAEESEVPVEAWEDASTVYGKYLETDEQNREVVNGLLGTEETDKVGYVGAEETYRFIGLNSTDESLKSSVRIIRTPEGTGLDITVNEEKGNITKVTEQMYENALMTSGIHDAEVVITTFQDVTGESALSGIYLAQELQGEEVSEDVSKQAQNELGTIVDINEENEGKEGYSQEQLNKAIAEVKTQVAEEGGDLTEEQVRDIVNETLEANGLTDFVNEQNVDRIVVVIMNGKDMGMFSGESADKFIESSKNLIGDITSSDQFKDAKDKASELGTDIKDTISDEGFQEKVKNFFVQIWEFLSGLFSSEEGTTNE